MVQDTILFLRHVYLWNCPVPVIIGFNVGLGNMWGKCDNGTEGLGCGRPETFRNCADVQIVTSTSGLPPQFIHNRPQHHLYNAALRGSDLRVAPQIYYPLVVK